MPSATEVSSAQADDVRISARVLVTFTQLKAPGSLQTRWLSEDVPYGIAAWSLLGEQIGVKTPLMRALVEIASATVGIDFWRAARTPQDLGITGMSVDALLRYAQTGQPS